jgi:hypothetical protein
LSRPFLDFFLFSSKRREWATQSGQMSASNAWRGHLLKCLGAPGSWT